MYRADAHFRTGISHETEGSPCQDYALAENGALPFAVISDGCSTSGSTDIGARLWCLAARDCRRYRAAKYEMTAHDLSSSMIASVTRVSRIVSVHETDLDATLGGVFSREDGRIRGILFGDGVFATLSPRGIEINEIEWVGNMPGYPSYLLSDIRHRVFVEQSELLAHDEAEWPCKVSKIRYVMGESFDRIVDGYSASGGLNGIQINWPYDTEIAAIMSDGAAQVSGLDLQTVVTELLSFGPARQGAFAKRRLNAALKKFAKDGHRPIDDISIAVLARVDDV